MRKCPNLLGKFASATLVSMSRNCAFIIMIVGNTTHEACPLARIRSCSPWPTAMVICVPLSLFVLAATRIPEFVDYPARTDWHGPPAPVKLLTSSERMFRTYLTEASKQPRHFAGHYRIVCRGCGFLCGASAVIDLQTGGLPAVAQRER